MDKRIPVKLSDSSVLDTEFSSIRERFDAEMRRMEDEMSNFRTQLIQRQENFFSNKSSLFDSSSSSRMDSMSNQLTQQQQQGNVLEGLSSPLIQEDGGDKTLKLRFDVSQYAPEEIVLKTIDNKLLVHAKHEEKSETKSVYREYNREFLLPSGVNPELIRSSLSKDGVLTVEAPLPQALQGGGAQQAIKF
ncbi:heat shock protein beta-1 isoform X1 [Folsomia candida]|uniref:heat shock protein beta-1 isoform X1 n=1 Tax=Folsomia candida TaxID=158441 RepID=UPI000B8EF112|nr:heat shock protein beta-1 isoform X1 [Folsomia candida]